jgi:hypothetical protein
VSADLARQHISFSKGKSCTSTRKTQCAGCVTNQNKASLVQGWGFDLDNLVGVKVSCLDHSLDNLVGLQAGALEVLGYKLFERIVSLLHGLAERSVGLRGGISASAKLASQSRDNHR